MPKKKPSLEPGGPFYGEPPKEASMERKTQWHIDRARYCTAVLAGCRFEKWCTASGSRSDFGTFYSTRWRLFMPKGGLVGEMYRSRRAAVDQALWFLEGHR